MLDTIYMKGCFMNSEMIQPWGLPCLRWQPTFLWRQLNILPWNKHPLNPSISSGRYGDGTFLVQPHGQENVFALFNFMNGLHLSIKFTMEMEGQGRVPSLDTLFYQKSDNTVDRKYTANTLIRICILMLQVAAIYHRKIWCYLHIHRAVVISDVDSLPKELSHLQRVLMANGYSSYEVQ